MNERQFRNAVKGAAKRPTEEVVAKTPVTRSLPNRPLGFAGGKYPINEPCSLTPEPRPKAAPFIPPSFWRDR